MSSLASRVAEQIADSLDLTDDGGGGDRRGRNFVLPSDLYAVRQAADELARHLSADPTQAARLTRALDRFAEVCATLIAARPAAFSVERVRAVVEAEAGDPLESPDQACDAIERASRAVERASW